jgi:sugar lactone lactonase YvrE
LYKIPHSIRIDPVGNVWTTDAESSTILKFTPEGQKLLQIDVGEQPPVRRSHFVGTTDIAFGPRERLFIADGYGNARVLEYAPDGKRVRQWGTPGSGPGQFRLPHGITLDHDNIIYVADRENGRVQKFDLDGKFLGEWPLGRTYSVRASGGASPLVSQTIPRSRKLNPLACRSATFFKSTKPSAKNRAFRACTPSSRPRQSHERVTERSRGARIQPGYLPAVSLEGVHPLL